MSLISKIFRRRRGEDYAEAIALYESGRFADSIALLRRQAKDQANSPTGSLASFHLRQALVGEGKRLLQNKHVLEAIPLLSEAAGTWQDYPDLQFLSGAAQGLVGEWGAALEAARNALRRNADYCEARLLEAAALAAMERPREAADSLNKLVESGRRVESRLVSRYATDDGYQPDSLPGDLVDALRGLVCEVEKPSEIGAAVALCRAGRWEEGIEMLGRLVAGKPNYPDYRMKLAAARFQVGQNEEALAEVDRALALNPRYRTAICLKALILADLRRMEEAREVLEEFAATDGIPERASHEDLFAAYLRAALALMTGRLDEVLALLEPWGDLTRTFPRAELVRAAVADLEGSDAIVAGRLAALVDAWPGDVEYHFLQACHQLRRGDLGEVERSIARWPVWKTEETDNRPLHLSACLDLARRCSPRIPPPDTEDEHSPAWRFVHAMGLAAEGSWKDCRVATRDLWQEGWNTERVARLDTAAASRLDDLDTLEDDWRPDPVVAESLVAPAVFLLHRLGRLDDSAALVERHARLHPEELRWHWLDPIFWLLPIRRWIA